MDMGTTVRVNGRQIAVAPGEDAAQVRERAWAELLRQEAVRQGRLDDVAGDEAPELSDAQQHAIEAMLEVSIETPEPTEAACTRYYHAHRSRFLQGQQLHVRHILFAVTDRVPVTALANKAEEVLLELTRQDVSPDAFAQQAQTWSNCPSGAHGGDLGWLTPHSLAPELAQCLFFQENGVLNGVQPRLVHSRFGLHIIDVQEQRPGVLAPFAQVHGRIAGELTLLARATALRHYMQGLVGQARIDGIELEGAHTPLVQ